MWVDIEKLSKQQLRKIKYILGNIEMPRIKIKIQTEDCLPEKTHKWDAGWDLKALKDTILPAGEVTKVHTGVMIEIPPHYCGMVLPRSSMGTKHRITLANDVGVIDSEYRGEIMVFLVNNSDVDYTIKKGDRFAQIVITAINNSSLWVVDRLSNTNRGDGGFGSTTENIPEKFDMADDALSLMNAVATNPCGEVVLGEVKETVLDLSVEDKRILAIAELKKLKPAEYSKLKSSGKLFDEYPIATGDMKQDLGI